MERLSSSLKVLHVLDSLDIGGGERHVVDLVIAQKARGHKPSVACSSGGALLEELRSQGVEVHVLCPKLVKRRVSLRFAAALRRVISSGGFDLVHSHMYASNAASALATIGTRVPLVITEHSEGQWRKQGARIVSRLVFSRSPSLIVNSEANKQRLVRVDRIDEDRITVIPGTVTPPGGNGAELQDAIPTEFRDKPLVGMVARLVPEKGPRTFIEAAAMILREVPEARFVVIGDGPLRGELEAHARRLGLEDFVAFLGFRPDARALLSGLSALALPSTSEGSPLVILEALLSGVPVVASAIGGIPSQIRDKRDGLLVPTGDAAALAGALKRLILDPPYARRLGASGSRYVQARFGHDSMVDKTQLVYDTLLCREPLYPPEVQWEGHLQE